MRISCRAFGPPLETSDFGILSIEFWTFTSSFGFGFWAQEYRSFRPPLEASGFGVEGLGLSQKFENS